jgi:sugar/nucleoside kinase (ribokinase family)
VAGLTADERTDVLARFDHGTERAATEPEIRDALRHAAGLGPVVSPGGSALNTVTVAARSCGVSVGYVGVCGRSPAERFDFPAWFREVGVDTRHVRPSERTCGLCVSCTHGGQRSLLTWDGANDEIFAHVESGMDALLRYCATARVVHVTSFAGGQDPAALARLLRRLRDEHPGVLISLDPGAGWSVPDRPPGAEDLVDIADLVLVNAAEFDGWTGRPPGGTDLDAARRFLRDRPAMSGALVVKRRDGVVLFAREGGDAVERVFPGTDMLDSSAVLDDTGAGDAFAAGFLSGVGVLGRDTGASVALGQRLARDQLQSVGMLGPAGSAGPAGLAGLADLAGPP